MIMPTENNGVIPANSGFAPLMYCVRSVFANSRKLPHLFWKRDIIVTSDFAPYSTINDKMTAVALFRNKEEHSNPKHAIANASTQFVPITFSVFTRSVPDSDVTDIPKKAMPKSSDRI